MSKRWKGSKNPKWKGGITSQNELIRKSKKYKSWARAIKKRDNYVCQICGKRGGELNADHIKKFSDYPGERFKMKNGRTLCVACHKKVTSAQQTELNNKINYETGKKNCEVWSGLYGKVNSPGQNSTVAQD